ncbi:RNA polymerase sigma factor [Flavisolibacter tropicus]|uniref:RNA polymerase subunit sigma-24 n=1 Tax=Flavisolibacter tropicus TaxID=1492898 RepID=A0A172TTN1_9BACT|nr:sigma-70 family RNA polymerase sigma factor [Flavisolibacter tropicus]ANE50318.1 RNA polymerase subunit sigma-24 [Flavisolibacter tropicus]
MKPGRYDHITDEQLLSLYNADGNQEWIGILLERYTLLLLGVCMKYLKNEEDAKDSVQQIFLKVLTEASKYQITYFKSWLYMVAKNHCLMKLRGGQNKNPQELTENLANAPAEDKKHEIFENERTYTLLEEAIEELNEEQKQCVTLFYIHKYSYNQIVEKTNFNLSQVKSYIQNGKRNLKLLLERKLNENPTKR